jgi:hypothetical protein
MKQRLQDLAWDGGELARAGFDLLRWPFERALWAIESGLLWPLRERRGGLPAPARTLAMGVAGLLLAAAVAFGAVRALDGGGEPAVVAAPASAPVTAAAPESAPEPAEPVLEGAAPDFSPATGDAAKVGGPDPVATDDQGSPDDVIASTAAATSSARAEVEDPGPAAIDVARRFSGAFVLYETGRGDAEVREALGATASPQLARALLQRPPRLPADVEVPKAKVLNVVPGPRHGDTYTLSASLLRVGVTSELRIDVQRDEKTKEWQVTDVLG